MVLHMYFHQNKMKNELDVDIDLVLTHGEQRTKEIREKYEKNG